MSKQSISLTPPEIYNVIGIGAGSVRLGTAIGLRQRSIENIFVIDRTGALRQVGQGINLLTNGLKTVKALNYATYEAVEKVGMRELLVHSKRSYNSFLFKH